MKKHLGLLLLLIAHNVYAMEMFIVNGIGKADEKCKLVAKYLYKYPVGQNVDRSYTEHLCIQAFFKDKNRIILSHRVQQYIFALKKAEIKAEEAFRLLCEIKNFPVELKQKIFVDVLWNDAQQYYAIDNALKFLAMSEDFRDGRFYSVCDSRYIDGLLKPYFLSELSENNQNSIQFSFDENIITEIDPSLPDHEPIKMKLIVLPLSGWVNGVPLACDLKVSIFKDLMAFVNAKQGRVCQFKEFLNQIAIHLLEVNDENIKREFLYWLGYFKDLTSSTLSVYRKEIAFGDVKFNGVKI